MSNESKFEIVQQILREKETHDRIRLNHFQSIYDQNQTEINRLAEKIKTSQIVTGASAAIGVLSGFLVSPTMQEYYANGLTNQQTYAATAVAAAGLGVATISTIIAHKMEEQSSRIEEDQTALAQHIEEEQSKIDETTAFETRNEQLFLEGKFDTTGIFAKTQTTPELEQEETLIAEQEKPQIAEQEESDLEQEGLNSLNQETLAYIEDQIKTQALSQGINLESAPAQGDDGAAQ